MDREAIGFSDRYAILAFAGTRADRTTDALSAAVRALTVAEALENREDPDAAVSLAGRMFRKTIADKLKERLKSMSSAGLIRQESSISSLEMANAGAKCWKVDDGAFSSILEGIREKLENGGLTDDDRALIWLIRESGALPFLMTDRELKEINGSSEMKEFPLWSVMFGKKLELGNVKRKMDIVPKAEDRTEGAFIEGIFLPEGDRQEALMTLLKDRGHDAIIEEEGDAPLLRIDGNLYRADMKARKTGRLTIEGISLRPACL